MQTATVITVRHRLHGERKLYRLAVGEKETEAVSMPVTLQAFRSL
uniref:Uncharacterized protein n=1 Tax=Anguilla anguilla TaxID=7936 RepID=A0A0E9VF97_ANGAN